MSGAPPLPTGTRFPTWLPDWLPTARKHYAAEAWVVEARRTLGLTRADVNEFDRLGYGTMTADHVVHVVQHLNRDARGRSRGVQDAVYRLKHRVTQALCERYPHNVVVERHEQVRECWGCDGTGIDGWHDEEGCDRCGGSGVFARHELFLFAFDFGFGDDVAWHIPRRLVTWDVEPFILRPTAAPVLYDGAPFRERDALSREGWWRLRAEPYAWALAAGVPADELPRLPAPSLRAAVVRDLEAVWYRHVVWPLEQRGRRLRSRIDRATLPSRRWAAARLCRALDRVLPAEGTAAMLPFALRRLRARRCRRCGRLERLFGLSVSPHVHDIADRAGSPYGYHHCHHVTRAEMDALPF